MFLPAKKRKIYHLIFIGFINSLLPIVDGGTIIKLPMLMKGHAHGGGGVMQMLSAGMMVKMLQDLPALQNMKDNDYKMPMMPAYQKPSESMVMGYPMMNTGWSSGGAMMDMDSGWNTGMMGLGGYGGGMMTSGWNFGGMMGSDWNFGGNGWNSGGCGGMMGSGWNFGGNGGMLGSDWNSGGYGGMKGSGWNSGGCGGSGWNNGGGGMDDWGGNMDGITEIMGPGWTQGGGGGMMGSGYGGGPMMGNMGGD